MSKKNFSMRKEIQMKNVYYYDKISKVKFEILSF